MAPKCSQGSVRARARRTACSRPHHRRPRLPARASAPRRHQATLLSLLDPWLADDAAAAASRGDTADVAFVGGLVRWMRSNFTLEPEGGGAGAGGSAPGSSGGGAADAAEDAAAAVAAAGARQRGRRRRGGGGGGGALRQRLAEMLRRPEGGVVGQLRRAAEARRGTAEQLNALLVALLRALGLLTRTTWWVAATRKKLIEEPIRQPPPWACPPRAGPLSWDASGSFSGPGRSRRLWPLDLRQGGGVSFRAAGTPPLCCRKHRSGMACSCPGCLASPSRAIDAVPFRPALAEAVLLRQLSSQVAGPSRASCGALTASDADAGGGGGTPGCKRRQMGQDGGPPASAAGDGDDEGSAAASGGGAGRGRGGGRGKRGRGRGRGRGGQGGGRGGGGAGGPGQAEAGVGGDGAEGGPTSGGAGGEAASDLQEAAAGAPRNRGEEEFQRQLEMALAATAAEAAARGSGAAGAGPSGGDGDGLPPRPGGGRGELWRLAAQGREGGSSGGGGQVWAAGAMPRCWAEVYLGSSATGRWVSLDGVTGWFDSVDRVDRDTARPQPLAYVVAAQGGAAKDVTRRYSRNYQAALKHRDEEWWAATMRALRGAAGAHLPPALRASVSAGGGVGAQVPVSAAAAAAAAGPSGSQAAAGGSGGGAVAEGDSAALRAKREDAELSHREAAHRRGVPNTIEGFKGHSLYVLQRHISKYQVGWAASGFEREVSPSF
jgi:hypothetical protein